eukprot:m.4172 g.4172  ORF g.4172 m.4172 type:complete len:153 (-) comp4435_c0_seq1:2344-2802(-)
MSFTDSQMSQFREAFALFDKKGDGNIRLGDLGTVLRAMGENPTQADVTKTQQEIDPDSNPDKRINFEEFLPVLQRFQGQKPVGTEADYIEGLRVFDKDGNGTINAAELRHVLASLGEKLSDDDLDALLANVPIDSSGCVNYQEFVRIVMGGN